ncbi:MAG: hypothetical protein EOP53_20420, partial [Sphingobacteriales bacterium]
MKIVFCFFVFLDLCCNVFSQNIGIGMSNPTRAYIEQYGSVNGTTAIFGGEFAGVSLQRSWPGIGFNCHANQYIFNGCAAKQYLDQNSGMFYFDLYSTGTTNANLNTTYRVFTTSRTGNMGINMMTEPVTSLQLNGGFAFTRHQVSITPQSGNFVEVGNRSHISINCTNTNTPNIILGDGLVNGQILIIESALSQSFQMWDNVATTNMELSSSHI